MTPDFIQCWQTLRDNEGEGGCPHPGREEAHWQAFSDFSDAVMALLRQDRLQDVVNFASSHMDADMRGRLITDVMSLVSRMDHDVGQGRISSTRLFAIPLTGPQQHLSSFHLAEGFGELLRQSGLFPDQSKLALIGAFPIEQAAAMRADTVARIVGAFERAMGEDMVDEVQALGPTLARLCMAEQDSSDLLPIGHAVIVGVCQHEAPFEELQRDDPLEAPSSSTDDAWLAQFTSWCDTHPVLGEFPFMSSPPAKWEGALADAVVQSILMDLATSSPGAGIGQMPKAARYEILTDGQEVVVDGFLADGQHMGTVRLPASADWLLPQVIQTWRDWGCQVDLRQDRAAVARPPRLN